MKTRLVLMVAVTALAALVNVAQALPAAPVLVTLQACPSGSKRVYPWLLYEDRDGDGLYDYVTAGMCDGTAASRPLGSAYADPFAPTPYDRPLCGVPDNAAAASVTLGGVHVPAGMNFYAWELTERTAAGVAVCRYTRDDNALLTDVCGEQYLN